ncbi:hypothetical protein [uncultured Chitinophaga sp.]|jgi:hypothetical protein|uniref:hypothetical protein n=1 Tax=uncultured Chitinophaga sp. TaxID=339340 RepID=UPI00262DF6E6|nr:hypothetical protein [uncultured Chitinophaga sp.]
MKRSFVLAIACIFLLLSCNNGGHQAGGPLLVKGRCAVFYIPGEDKIRELKREFGEKDFPGIATTNEQYMNEARQFLTEKKVKIINTSQYELRFEKSNGDVYPVNLNRSKYAWEIFLFNGFDDPVKIDITNIREEFKAARMGVNN